MIKLSDLFKPKEGYYWVINQHKEGIDCIFFRRICNDEEFCAKITVKGNFERTINEVIDFAQTYYPKEIVVNTIAIGMEVHNRLKKAFPDKVS